MERCHLAIITNNEKGINLSLKLKDKGYNIALYDIDSIMNAKGTDPLNKDNMGIARVYDIDSLVLFLEEPKKVFLVGDASVFSDQMLSIILKKLPHASTIVDFCDRHYEEVAKRVSQFNDKGIYYLSLGFIEGLDNDFCLFPGGSYQAYLATEDILEATCDNESYYLGPDGAGQFCKMVHDGINSTIIQLIVEHIDFLKEVLACDNDEIYNILNDYNSRESLNSYALDILIDVYRRVDYDSNSYLVDLVSDLSYFDFSSSWLGQAVMLLGLACPSLLAPINVRHISYQKEERVELANYYRLGGDIVKDNEKKAYISLVESSLYMSIAISYAQAYSLLFKASDIYAYDINFDDLMKLLNNSSLIRSRLLKRIEMILKDGETPSLLLKEDFIRITKGHIDSLRKVVSKASLNGVSMPGAFASLSYIDLISKDNLPTGISQLYKDYIEGAGYEKKDEAGRNYGDWKSPNKLIVSKKQKN